MTALHDAWDELHRATPSGWYGGTPVYHGERDQWALYAFDTREKAHIGRRSREWTAVAPTEAEAVAEMAGSLREIASSRRPK